MKSRKARDEFVEFLRGANGLRPFHQFVLKSKHFQALDDIPVGGPWDNLKNWIYPTVNDPTSYLRVGDAELSYGNGDLRIGFNYSTCFMERGYMYCICRWLALRGGKRKQLNALSNPVGYMKAVPYYLYDHEPNPILIPSDLEGIPDWSVDWKYLQRFLVDDLGWRVCPILAMAPWPEDDPRWEPYKDMIAFDQMLAQIVREEIVRLDEAWKAR